MAELKELTQVFCLRDTFSNVEHVDEYDPISVLCNNDENNVINGEENASEYSFHKVNVVDSDVEEDKDVRDIIENLSEDFVERVTVVQKMAHAQARVGVTKANNCYA